MRRSNPTDEEDEEGYFIDFLLSQKLENKKVHYLLELKTKSKNRKGLVYNSLLGLKQIFERDYHNDLLPLNDTQAVVNIGIAANTTNTCLSILKIPVHAGNYGRPENLTWQNFFVTKDADNNTRSDHLAQKYEEINISKSTNGTETTVSGADYVSNEESMKRIAVQISKLVNETSKDNEKVG
jgi:hypothetical protein